MEINKNSIKSIINSYANSFEGLEEANQISFFVICPNQPRLKKLNLGDLSSESLKLIATEHRLILVVEKGEAIFAHAHEKYIESIQLSDELSLSGKKITLKTLTDEEAEKLAAVASILGQQTAPAEEAAKTSTQDRDRSAVNCSLKQKKVVATFSHLSFSSIERKVKTAVQDIIKACLKRFEEERKELEDKQQIDQKFDDIKKSEIKKMINRSEITKKEIARLSQ